MEVSGWREQDWPITATEEEEAVISPVWETANEIGLAHFKASAEEGQDKQVMHCP
jgi:hypothetical protein